MALRILARFTFACTLALFASATQSSVAWFPVNSEFEGHTTSGIDFRFVESPTPQIGVWINVIDQGMQYQYTGSVEADNSRGGSFFACTIHSLDGFRVRKMILTFGTRRLVLDDPIAGHKYEF